MRTPALALPLFTLATALTATTPAAADEPPIGVSPGRPGGFARVADPCPTFTWAHRGPATTLELLVYEIGDPGEGRDSRLDEPVLRVALPAAAGAWAPSLDSCLEPGRRYSWVVRTEAPDGAVGLSQPRLFAVPAAPAPVDVRRAARLLADYLAATRGGDVPGSTGQAAGDSAGSAPPEAEAGSSPSRRSLEAFIAAFSAAQEAGAGIAHGVVGTTNSADGAGLAGDNSAGGADLLLGAATAAESAAVSEDGFTRESADDLAFDFRNTGTGSMSLRVDSTDVLTTASGAAVAHSHAGEDVDSGTVAEARIDAAVARDVEIVPAVLAADGAGSGLDADLLDGNEAAAFAPAAGSGSYVAKSGDTMTGALALPADGLLVGAGQLSASGGRVGIGTASPSGGVLHLSSTGSQLYIEDSDTPERNVAQLFMQDDLVRLVANHFLAGTPSIDISLETRDAGSPLEAMRLKGDGKVGIGTATPAHPLHLRKALGGSHLIAAIENTAAFSAAALRLKTPAAGSEWNLVAQESGGGAARGFEVQHAGFATPPLAIDAASGFVGLGKLSPSERLEVSGNAKATAFIGDGSQLTGLPAASDVACAGCVAESELAFATATQAELDAHKASGDHDAAYVNTAGDTMTGSLTLSPAAGDALVTTAGNVGFGTASPAKAVHAVGQGAVFNTATVAAPLTQPFFSIETDLYSAFTGILSVLDRRAQNVATKTPILLVQNTNASTHAENPLIEARAAGSTRLMLQQDGNLGLHTDSPSHPFHLKKSLGGSHLIASIENTGSFAAAALQLETPGAGNEWNLTSQSNRGFEVQNASFVTPPLAINYLSGFVGINNLTPADRLDVAGDIRVGTGTTGCVKDADGTLIAGTCSSDARLKTNVAPLGEMLDRVARLEPVTFNWRAEEFPDRALGDETQLGLIAQQVREVLPELVVEDEDGLLRVRYSELPLLLIQAVKEQRRENERLRQRLAALAQRLARLESRRGGRD